MRIAPWVALAILGWLGGLAQPALSQTVTVQSGEHADFTRLVLDVGPDRTWDIGEVDAGRRVTFDPAVAQFDMAGVFDLIPRTRLQALRTEGGLVLDLACACPVSATRYQGRFLILDIRNAAPVTPDPGSTAPDETAARRLAAAESLPDLTAVLLEQGPAQPDAGETALVTQPPDTRLALQDAAQIMAEQLARAAATGLIEAAPGRPLSDADPTRPVAASVEMQPATLPAGQPLALNDLAFELPIRAETAVDAALQRSSVAEPQRPRLACTGREFDMRDWAGGDRVDHGLGRLRMALFDDRDQLEPDAVTALARHYISFGFGAEARFWLSELSDPPQDLIAMSHLVDGAEGPFFPTERNPAACSANELLWRYIDGMTPEALTATQVGRLQRAAAGLPVALRDHLGLTIARRLHSDGYPSAARNIRDMLVRGGRVDPSAVLHLDMDIGLAGADDPGATRQALALALRDDGASAPRALAHALRFDRETGIMISQTRLLAAEALLREVGPGPDTRDLWHELVLAHATAADIDRVLDLLSDPARDPAVRNPLLSAVFQNRLDAEDTPALLLLARTHGATWTATGSDAGRARVGTIAFLRDQGFIEAAEVIRGAQRMLILPARPARADRAEAPGQAAWEAEDWLQIEGLIDGPHRDLAARMRRLSEGAQPNGLAADPDLDALAHTLTDTGVLRETLAAVLAAPSPQFGSDRP